MSVSERTSANEVLASWSAPAMDEAALVEWISRCAPAFKAGAVVYLGGDLGAGKTTLARALIQALGYTQRVKSPTYSLLEEYPLPGLTIAHLDLYRLTSPGDVMDLGLEDFGPDCLMLVEWAEQGIPFLAAADLRMHLELCTLATGQSARRLHLAAYSARGLACLHECAASRST